MNSDSNTYYPTDEILWSKLGMIHYSICWLVCVRIYLGGGRCRTPKRCFKVGSLHGLLIKETNVPTSGGQELILSLGRTIDSKTN